MAATVKKEHRLIREAIVARMASVKALGKVYAFERYVKDDKGLRDVYQERDGSSINGWHVRRVARRETGKNREVLSTWELRGFRSLQDGAESELAMDDAVDELIDAWRDDPRLGRVVLPPLEDQPDVPEMIDSGPVMFCGVLCHSVRLRVVTRTQRDD